MRATLERMSNTRRFLIALVILFLGPIQACHKDEGAAASGGKLKVLKGSCTVTTAKGEATTVQAGPALVDLAAGSVVETAKDSAATVSWGRTSHILHDSTKLTFVAESAAYGATSVELAKGVADFLLPKQEKESEFKFQAAAHTIVAAVKGTAFRMTAGEAPYVKVETMRGTVFLFAAAAGATTAGQPPGTGARLSEVTVGAAYENTPDGPKSSALPPAAVTQFELESEALTGNAILNF